MSRHRADPSSPRTLVVLLSGIGDAVHGLPVVEGLRAADPGGEITWVAQPGPAELLVHNPSVDRIVRFRRGAGIRGALRLRRELRGGRFDRSLNFMRYLKGVLPVALTWPRVRVGLPPSKTREGAHLFANRRPPEGPWVHVQELFLRFLDVLGVPRPDPLRWPIPLSEEERAAREAFFGPLSDRPVAGLVLGSRVPEKDWPAERHARLAESLHSDLGYRVLILGGPSDSEREAAEGVVEAARVAVTDAREDSVRALVWKISGCDLVVSPDTAGLHVAHALEVPVVGLFGYTNPWRTGPYLRYRDLVVDAFTNPGEAPGPEDFRPRGDRMRRIGVDDVLEKVALARERYGAGERKRLAEAR